MNFGECPYCNGMIMVSVPEQTPAYAKIKCDECGKDVWYKFSRLDPEAWTVEDFEASHTICDETKTITPNDTYQGRVPETGEKL